MGGVTSRSQFSRYQLRAQGAEPPSRPWETRARNITEILLADLPLLEKTDKAMLLARLGESRQKGPATRAKMVCAGC